MAFTPAKLGRGTLSAVTTTVLYTSTAGTIVKQIVVSNTTAASATATLAIGGTTILGAVSVAANSVAIFDLSQVMIANETITGGSGTASALSYAMSGVTF